MSTLDISNAPATCHLDLLASTALRQSETEMMLEIMDPDVVLAKPSPAFRSIHGTPSTTYASPVTGRSQSEPKYITPVSPALLPSPCLVASPNVTRTMSHSQPLRPRSDSVTTIGSENSKRSSPSSPNISSKRLREANGQEWTEEETKAFYRVKQQLAAIHPKLRIGASRNVGVGRVRLQCKVGVTVSTIKTFGVEEINEILRVAEEWARERGNDDEVETSTPKSKGGSRTPKSRSQSIDVSAQNNMQPLTPQTPLSLPASQATPLSLRSTPVVSASNSTTNSSTSSNGSIEGPVPVESEKERKIRVFCERLNEFLVVELRQLI